jgi:apolipoprotein N-acyltransferase
MSREPNHNKTTNPLKQYARYSGIAFQMMAVMAFSAWLGLKADKYLELQFPLFTLIFIITALGLILYKMVRSL